MRRLRVSILERDKSRARHRLGAKLAPNEPVSILERDKSRARLLYAYSHQVGGLVSILERDKSRARPSSPQTDREDRNVSILERDKSRARRDVVTRAHRDSIRFNPRARQKPRPTEYRALSRNHT